MKVTLAKRHHGFHQVIKTCEVPGRTSDYVTYRADPLLGRVPVVREDRLLAALASDWLSQAPDRILLMVSDGDGGGEAVGKPRRFRPWGKYFDSYSLTLERSRKAVSIPKNQKETAS